MDGAVLERGMRLGKYEIVERIGDGGMGVVYEALHTELRQPVALKVLHPYVARNEVARARMIREGRAAARISHPNIVQMHDAGYEKGLAYLAMEKLEGEDLRTVISREAPLSPSVAVDLLLPVIAAIDAAHQKEIVHRDLKPSNVFLTRSPGGVRIPKVVDFGISKLRDATFGLTRTAEMLGTPAYMAPEQMEEARDVDGRADIYAIGILLYECLTGVSPFEGKKGPMALLHAASEGKYPRPREIVSDIPAALEKIVLKCMERDPDERFGAALELADALAPFASDSGRRRFEELDPRQGRPAASARVGSEQATMSARPKKGVLIAAIGAIATIAAASIAILAWPSGAFRVQVTADPAIAEIRVDGAPRGTGSIDIELPRDGRAHTLAVSAPGYEPTELTFTDEPPPPRVVLTSMGTQTAPIPEPAPRRRTRSSDPPAIAAPPPEPTTQPTAQPTQPQAREEEQPSGGLLGLPL